MIKLKPVPATLKKYVSFYLLECRYVNHKNVTGGKSTWAEKW